eukprot:2366643-Alexandrium_andersonii.AAC.1
MDICIRGQLLAHGNGGAHGTVVPTFMKSRRRLTNPAPAAGGNLVGPPHGSPSIADTGPGFWWLCALAV